MTSSRSPESIERSRSPGARGRGGLSLLEVILATVVLGTALSPLALMINRQIRQSRTHQRFAVAESLTRAAIEHLKWRRRSSGFDWLWARAGTTMSGLSNPAGSATNPALDSQLRGGGGFAPTTEFFDREVRIVRRQQTLNGTTVRFLEIDVTILNHEDPLLAPRPPPATPHFTVRTMIGEAPGS